MMESDGRLIGRREFVTQLGFAGGVVAMHGHVPRLLAQSQRLMSVSLGGFDLYYEVHGEGPPVVFAHGAGGTHLGIREMLATVPGVGPSSTTCVAC